MENIEIRLLHHTPKEVLFEALKKCYRLETADMNLAKKVIKVNKHESVAEHITMHFDIVGVSRAELQEHMRHRIASTTCESTRYTLQLLIESLNVTDMNETLDKNFILPSFFKPEDWKLKNDKDNFFNYKLFCSDLDKQYESFIEFYKKWRELGVKNDYMKYGLPEGYRTTFIWTINFRALKNFLNLRNSKSAHFEIHLVAEILESLIKDTYIGELL